MAVEVDPHDTDVSIVLPTGVRLLVQYRIENETVDVCLCKGDAPYAAHIYVTDANLTPAKKSKGGWKGEQITICL